MGLEYGATGRSGLRRPEQVADGLGLVVLDAATAHGIVLAPTTGSMFAQRLADYRA